MTPTLRGALRLGLLTAVLVVVPAIPAAADPARPTNYRSTVVTIDPPTRGVRVDVVGGDSFLRLRTEPGRTVVVLGYDNEPYLRFNTDASVEENLRSPAVLLNTARYGTLAPQPAEVDPKAEPRWRRVGGGAEYAWHDHRVHWMGKAKPPQLGTAATGKVDDWTVPLLVDGTPVTVQGTLELTAAPTPLPWLGLAVIFTATLYLLARRFSPIATLGAAMLFAGAFAGAVAVAGQLGLPDVAGRRPSLYIIPDIVALCGLGAVILRQKPSAIALLAGAALTFPLWIVLNAGVLTHAVAPTDIDETLQRATISIALAVTLACLLAGVRAETRSLMTPLDQAAP